MSFITAGFLINTYHGIEPYIHASAAASNRCRSTSVDDHEEIAWHQRTPTSSIPSRDEWAKAQVPLSSQGRLSVINLDTVAEVTIFNLLGLALAIFSSWCITAYVTTAPGKWSLVPKVRGTLPCPRMRRNTIPSLQPSSTANPRPWSLAAPSLCRWALQQPDQLLNQRHRWPFAARCQVLRCRWWLWKRCHQGCDFSPR